MEQNFSKIKSRIIEHIDYQGISKRKFYEKTGMSNGLLDKKTGITEDGIEKYLQSYPEINPIWLLTGKGNMLNDSSEIKKQPHAHNGIPLVGWEAVAGFGNAHFAIDKEDVQAEYIVPDFKDVDFMIALRGSSMYPKYSAGDIVACRIIRESGFIQWNKTYIIATTEQGILCKRLNPSDKPDCILAVSDNKDYKPFDIPKNEITGIALIIGVIRLE